MLKNKWLLFVSCLLVPVAVVAKDNQDVSHWLQKMHHAAHMLNYVGKFVYQQDTQLSLMQIIHAVSEHGERERLISLDQVGREVIRDANGVTCILPDRNSIVVDKARPQSQFPPKFPVDIEHLKGQYHFKLDKQERVAGQLAQKIVIDPVDQYRYGHRLWVDVDTGLLLKTYLVDERGRLLEQFMFTEIEFMDQIEESMLVPQTKGTNYTWYESKEDEQSKPVVVKHNWSVSQLPRGFMRDMQRQHNMPNKQVVKHLVYTDGLASVSIFIETPEQESPNPIGASRMGAVNAYGRVVDKHHVTAVGEVPHVTVKMISESVTYKH